MDAQDNCPGVYNFYQADSDRDGLGDVCDSTFDQTSPAAIAKDPVLRSPRILVVAYHYADKTPPEGDSQTRARLTGGDGPFLSVERMLLEQSQGAVRPRIEFSGWQSAAGAFPTYQQRASDEGRANFPAAVLIQDIERDLLRAGALSSVDTLVVLVDSAFSSSNDGVGCRATTGASQLTDFDSGQTAAVRRVDLNMARCGQGQILHEVGHTFDLDHVASVTCIDGAYPSGAQWESLHQLDEWADGQCAASEVAYNTYADHYIMGNYAGLFSSFDRVRVGWLPEANVFRPPVGISEEWIHPQHAFADDKKRAYLLEFGRDVGNYPYGYALEVRSHSGVVATDVSLERVAYRNTPNTRMHTELVLLANQVSWRGEQYASQSGTVIAADAFDGNYFKTGDSYHDPYRGVRITLTEQDDANLRVRVRTELSGLRGVPGDVLKFGDDATQTVELVNQGSETITLSNFRLRKGNTGAFQIQANGCAGSLAPRARCAVRVRSQNGTLGSASYDGRAVVLDALMWDSTDPLRPQPVVELIRAVLATSDADRISKHLGQIHSPYIED